MSTAAISAGAALPVLGVTSVPFTGRSVEFPMGKRGGDWFILSRGGMVMFCVGSIGPGGRGIDPMALPEGADSNVIPPLTRGSVSGREAKSVTFDPA
jgi:hypothetical protein